MCCLADGRQILAVVDKPSTLPQYYSPIMASECVQRQIDLLLDDIEYKVGLVPASFRYTG